MRAIIVQTGRRISPFGDRPREVMFAARTVGVAVEEALRRRGLDIVVVDADAPVPAGDGPAVVLADHCFVSEKVLGDFLGAAFDLDAADGARLALAKTPSVEFTLPLSSASTEPFDAQGPGAKPATKWRYEAAASERVAYDCFFVKALPSLSTLSTAGALLEFLRARATRVVVPKRELGIPLRLPTLGDGQQNTQLIPITSTLAAHVEHWCHILWLNQAGFGVRWLELARTHKAWAFWRLFTAAPWTMPAIMHRFVRRGRNVRIHPTAWVEASILGDNVEIGAGASVRNSILGNGVVVGDHATVLSSTLGDRVAVTPRTFVVWSAAFEDAVLSNYKLQVSVIGRGASLSTWAGFIDAKLQGTIDVLHDGRLQSTGRNFLGSALGHGAHVGAKVLLLPGRELPNGTFVTMRDDEIIRRLPADLPAGVPHVRDAGTLVPLQSARTPPSTSTAAPPSSATPAQQLSS
jgi:acetyltransferase-like isoleucine patch superfamily enzyme